MAELRSWLCAAALAALAPALGAAAQISGEVYAIGAQVLRTPQSQNGQVVLQNYVPDGTRVRKGDVVLSIDGAA
ncbi:MAG: hemolysin D, partial [Rhodanobacteraceae bacterium]|nr:hemolysin D [Rhodanobacteraceae bacterium]